MALAEKEIWRLRHHHEADEEDHWQNDTENPKDQVANEWPNSVDI